MKKYETVIFDLDGTLLYTLEDLTKATNYALRRMNMPERTLDDVRRFVGSIMIFTAMTIQKPMTE